MEDTQTPRTKVLKNGAVYDLDKGRIVANPGGGTTAITPERSRELKEIRAAKVARRLREKITSATAKVSDLPVNSSVEAVAEVGGILWEEIVLNPDAYPRDRLAAFNELTERAEMTSNHKRGEAEKSNVPREFAAAATELIRRLADTMQPRDVIEGKVTDTRNE